MVKQPKRVHRDEQTEDAFIARLVEYSEWARRNVRVVTAVAILLAIAIGGLVYWRSYRSTMEERAAARLTEIQQTVASGNTALAVRDLDTYLANFSGTRPAREARLLLGEIYLNDGRFREALQAVEPLAEDPGRPLGASAAFLRAAAHEALDGPREAERVYMRIAESAPMDFQRQRALADAARIRMDRNDAAGAAELYERLVEMVDQGHPDRGLYEMRLAEAQAASAAASAQEG